jgi:hypothetical protein
MLPSGARLYPTYGGQQVDPNNLPSAQAGQGVVVKGQGAEAVSYGSASELALAPKPVCKPKAPTPAPDKVPAPHDQLAVKVHELGDEKLVFLSDKETKRLANPNGSEESTESSSESDSDEEEVFQTEAFLKTAQIRLDSKSQLRIQQGPPAAISASLVGKKIAFHHGDGWDAGTILEFYTPGRFKKQQFNVNIDYPAKGGSVSTKLELSKYGVGDENGSQLSSWVHAA